MLSEVEALSSLMLERLFWARVMAVVKYGKQPIEDRQREKQVLDLIEKKCLKEKFSPKMQNIFLSFFQNNIELSKFVQESYSIKWKALSEEEMLLVYQETNAIIENENQENLDQFIFVRRKMTIINEKILKKLMNIQKIMSRNLYENT